MTKLELTQINARLAAENADLRAQLSDVQAMRERLERANAEARRVAEALREKAEECDALRAQLSRSTEARRSDFSYVMSPEAAARREATLAYAAQRADEMAAAKAEAMASGRCVRV
jgi:predicted nuclease with TOPRIM domain